MICLYLCNPANFYPIAIYFYDNPSINLNSLLYQLAYTNYIGGTIFIFFIKTSENKKSYIHSAEPVGQTNNSSMQRLSTNHRFLN